MSLLDLIDVHRLEWDPGYDRPSATRAVSSIDTFELHHTGGAGPRSLSYEDKKRWIEGIRDYHVNTKGWSDIFYHVIVFADGEIWGGRTLDRASQSNIPTTATVHIPGNNPEVTAAQLDGLLSVARACTSDPTHVTYHSARSATACPGSNGVAAVNELRRRLNDAQEAPYMSWTDQRPPEDLGDLPEADTSASRGFINNESPERVASRSVVSVVAARVDDASRTRDDRLKAAQEALGARLDDLNQKFDNLELNIEIDGDALDVIVAAIIDRLENG